MVLPGSGQGPAQPGAYLAPGERQEPLQWLRNRCGKERAVAMETLPNWESGSFPGNTAGAPPTTGEHREGRLEGGEGTASPCPRPPKTGEMHKCSARGMPCSGEERGAAVRMMRMERLETQPWMGTAR